MLWSNSGMRFTRREFSQIAAAGALGAAAKPDSKFHGVQVGTITYSFRAIPNSAEEILKYCVELGISSVEMLSDAAERYAGAPEGPQRGRGQMTPEMREAMRKAGEERTKWRLGLSMDKYKTLRKLYNDAGVRIEIFKLPLTAAMNDDECNYVFTVAKALGASSITMELPSDPALSARAGKFAERHKVFVGYHNHMQVNESSWETALGQSKYNSINLDVGHFTEAISGSPIPFIQRNHARITSFHLKDKKYGTKGGGNVPWGQGDVPLREVLQMMAKEKYRWPANIELEYNVPEGSSVMAEMARCVKFCREAIG